MATKYEWYNPTPDYAYQLETNYIYAQTFTVGTTGTNENFNLYSVKLFMGRTGSPGTITIAIRAVDGSGLPTGGDLSTGTTNGNNLSDVEPEIREILMSSVQLNANTKYAILMKAEIYDEDNYVIVAELITEPSYNGGGSCADLGGWFEWDPPEDFWFEVWGTALSTGTNTRINIGDNWKEVSTSYINIGDVWKPINTAYINVGDSWKKIF